MRSQDFRQWRVIELRPGIFGVEYRRRLFFDILGYRIVESLGWGWHDWNRESWKMEFKSQLAAENYVIREKSNYADEFYRKFGVPGYPRVIE